MHSNSQWKKKWRVQKNKENPTALKGKVAKGGAKSIHSIWGLTQVSLNTKSSFKTDFSMRHWVVFFHLVKTVSS